MDHTDDQLIPPPPPPPPRGTRFSGTKRRVLVTVASLGFVAAGLGGGFVVANAATTATPAPSASPSTGSGSTTHTCPNM